MISFMVAKFFPVKKNHPSPEKCISQWNACRLSAFLYWQNINVRHELYGIIYTVWFQSSKLLHTEKFTIFTVFREKSFNTTFVHRCRSVWAFYHFFNRTNDNLIRIRTKMKITRLATRFSNYTQLFQVKLNTVTSTSITVAF